MEKALGQPLSAQGDEQNQGSGGGAGIVLERLRRRFADFRRKHPAQTRVPEELRAAVLAAMRQGVTQTEVQRACKLTSRQLGMWQRSQGIGLVGRKRKAQQKAKIFSVTEDISREAAQARSESTRAQLELRVGDWSVSIRQLSP